MRAGLDSNVPVLSLSLTPHNFQDTDHHRGVFAAHLVEKGREVARAALSIVETRNRIAASAGDSSATSRKMAFG
jgi:6,7-dimethyl-8-ribityllumazine synthase